MNRCAAGCGRNASTLFLATAEWLCADCWWRAFEILTRSRRPAPMPGRQVFA